MTTLERTLHHGWRRALRNSREAQAQGNTSRADDETQRAYLILGELGTVLVLGNWRPVTRFVHREALV